ncbi:MAG: hypothetical protein K2X29_01135, partial [Candidatus Obscuribacterales bacterium]|nr:hypothetical protein [Candidatus Obscuribacterales bacterium]
GEAIPQKVVYHHDRTDILTDLPIVGGKTADDVVYQDSPNFIQSAARGFRKAKEPVQEQMNQAVSDAMNPAAKKQQ